MNGLNTYLDNMLSKLGLTWNKNSRMTFGIGVLLIPLLALFVWFLPAFGWYSKTKEVLVLVVGIFGVCVSLYLGLPKKKKTTTQPTATAPSATVEGWFSMAKTSTGKPLQVNATPPMLPAWLVNVLLFLSLIVFTIILGKEAYAFLVGLSLVSATLLVGGIFLLLGVVLVGGTIAGVPGLSKIGLGIWKQRTAVLVTVVLLLGILMLLPKGNAKEVVATDTQSDVVSVSDTNDVEETADVIATFNVTNSMRQAVASGVASELNSGVSMIIDAYNAFIAAQEELLSSTSHSINWAEFVGDADTVNVGSSNIPNLLTLQAVLNEWLNEAYYQEVEGELVRVEQGFKDRTNELFTTAAETGDEQFLEEVFWYSDLADQLVDVVDALTEIGISLNAEDVSWTVVARNVGKYNASVDKFNALVHQDPNKGIASLPLFELDSAGEIAFVQNLIYAETRSDPTGPAPVSIAYAQVPVSVATPADPTDTLIAASQGVVPVPTPTVFLNPAIGPEGCERPEGVSGSYIGRAFPPGTPEEERTFPDGTVLPEVYPIQPNLSAIAVFLTDIGQYVGYESGCDAHVILIGALSEVQTWDLVKTVPPGLRDGDYVWSDIADTFVSNIYVVDQNGTKQAQIWPALVVPGVDQAVDAVCDSSRPDHYSEATGWALMYTQPAFGDATWQKCATPGLYRINYQGLGKWVFSDVVPANIPENTLYTATCTFTACTASLR